MKRAPQPYVHQVSLLLLMSLWVTLPDDITMLDLASLLASNEQVGMNYRHGRRAS